LIAADASVAIASFAPWHEHQYVAQTALGPRPAIIAHAAFETYSVLTRLPEGQRAPAALVVEQLSDRFSDRWLSLSASALQLALNRLEELGISGGATYDGLIAMTAAAEGATLVTLDRRARRTYALVGADVELVA
jgi:predicted nucleic acid-binding protein